jgi:hypothetical protein
MNRTMQYTFVACRTFSLQRYRLLFACLLTAMLLATEGSAAPQLILISLDGAASWLVDQYLASGVLSRQEGGDSNLAGL